MSRLSAKFQIGWRNYLDRVVRENKAQIGGEQPRGYNLNKRVNTKEDSSLEQ